MVYENKFNENLNGLCSAEQARYWQHESASSVWWDVFDDEDEARASYILHDSQTRRLKENSWFEGPDNWREAAEAKKKRLKRVISDRQTVCCIEEYEQEKASKRAKLKVTDPVEFERQEEERGSQIKTGEECSSLATMLWLRPCSGEGSRCLMDL